MRTAWLFPGQGSQRAGMGAEEFDRFPQLCAQADDVLGYSVRELCLTDAARLRQTRYAQPALYVVGALAYLARERDGGRPDFLAGHSLGEYGALFAAGCVDFATGLRLVARRAELMEQAAGGAMAAVVGVDPDRLAALLAGEALAGLDVANYNSPDQVVVSGPQPAIRALTQAVRELGSGTCIALNVSVACHSRYMAPAAAAFGEALAGVRFAAPNIPLISNVTARPHRVESVAELLAAQIRRPVRWLDSMRYLIDEGVTGIEEIGPGDVLTRLWAAARRVRRPAIPPSGEPAARADATAGVTAPARRPGLSPERLGSAEFRRDYGVRYAYLSGAMFKGIASTDLVIRMARAGLMGFFGAGGLSLSELADALATIRAALGPEPRYGMNLLASLDDDALERDTVDLYLRHDVRHVEAAAYTQVSAPLIRFRYAGAHRDAGGRPVAVRHVLAKVSRPEVAAAFMQPAPEALVRGLLAAGALTPAEAEVARELPVSDDICVEADSGGHTDARSAYALMPAMQALRDAECARHGYAKRIRVGASGGIGSPEAVAAAFVMGADFVVTGSVNQCTPEAGTSAAVKDLLAGLDVQDTAYAPAGDMFELGARVQVVRKGTLFPARANKLYQLYRQHGSLEEIDPATRRGIEERYLRRSFADVWDETRSFLAERRPHELAQAERNPRHRMALLFRWYFVHSIRLALAGDADQQVNFQVHCGPAMGSFNRFAAGADLVDWRQRHVDVIAERLMHGAADLLDRRLRAFAEPAPVG